MADKENHRVQTRSQANRKRLNQFAEEEEAEGGAAMADRKKQKRVALGDLTNLGSAAVSGLGSRRSRKPKAEEPVDDTDCGEPMRKTWKPKSEPVAECVGDGVDLESAVRPGVDGSRKNGYGSSILQHLRDLEVQSTKRPLSNYMELVQDDVKPPMRSTLVDWLVEVAEEYQLVSETLYLTITYIDRFLSSCKLTRNKLQLLGVTCMLVASKYEEIRPPHVEDFCYITDNTYTKEQVVQMERDVLKFLHFEMSGPTTKTFLSIFAKASQDKPVFLNLQFNYLCCYLAELSLLDYGCVRHLPSAVAASVIFLARLTIQPSFHPWTLALQQGIGYKPIDLKECVLRLHSLFLRSETSARALRQKYMDHKFKYIASLNPPSEIPAWFFEVSNE